MLVIVATLDFHPDDMPTALELTRTICVETLREKGCHHYSFAVDNLNPGRFQIAEWWESEDDLQAHLRMAHVDVFRSAIGSLRFLGTDAKQFEVVSVGPVNVPED
jgi:quinol monooxygenase YgiN